jgi:predicted nucleic acid-binding protein
MGTLKNTLVAMQGRKVYFDTNIIVYFLERNQDYFEKCLPFFQAVEDGSIIGVAGDLTIAELLVRPISINDIIGVKRVHALFGDEAGFFQVFPHDRSTLEFAAHIRATQKLSMVDAVHLATAIHAQCGYFITNDAQVSKRAKGIEVVCLKI